MFKVPFWLLPSTWHLSGQEYERAKLVYELSDEDEIVLARALLDIDYEPGSPEYHIQKAHLDHADGLITDHEYDIAVARQKLDGLDLEIELISLDERYGVISSLEAEKRTATAKGESWVGGPLKHAGEGGVMFDLEWNSFWIDELRQNGYTGKTDQEIMNKWFAALHFSEVIATRGADMDPFFYEVARAELNKLIGRDD